MKTHENESRTRRVWFDRNLRLWTLQLLDENGDQVGSVDYTTSRTTALDWMNSDDSFPNR